ncbi:MAG: methyltransferase [Pseudomonadota bacterium]
MAQPEGAPPASASVEGAAEVDLEALADAYNRGLACEKAGDRAGAVAAFRAALALDPEDRGGCGLRLAALGALTPEEAPVTAPPAYVATLFDQTAERFDEILVEQLGYAVPMLLRERLDAIGAGPFGRLLDLGCGTGLAGESLADLAEEVTGVDLSEEMLGEADARGAYDALYAGDAAAFLAVSGEEGEPPFDLIVATDMLPYLGALEALFEGLAARLARGGLVALSAETMAQAEIGPSGYCVGAHHRFAHSERYLRARLAAVGLLVRDWQPITVRYESGTPVPGVLLIAAGPGG